MNDSLDSEENCPICFESFTNYEGHRLACLKCGHLFGDGCIKKWLGEHDVCPQCKTKARSGDIRILYAKNLKVLDTAERDEALKEAERQKEQRIKIEMENVEMKNKLKYTQMECNRINEQIRNLQDQIKHFSQNEIIANGQDPNSNKYVFEQIVNLSTNQSCRLLSYVERINMIAVSLSNDSSLFPKWGIRKINAIDMKPAEYVGLHSKPIKGMSFNFGISNLNESTNSSNFLSNEALLLTASLDKTVRITSMQSNTSVQKYLTEQPCWSCQWNINNSNQFFVGLSNGCLNVFDIRNTSAPFKEIPITSGTGGGSSPITCIKSLPASILSKTGLTYGGIVIAQLNKSFLLEETVDQNYVFKRLDLEGKIIDINYENSTNHLLASFGTTSKHETTRYQLFTLPEPDSAIEIEEIEHSESQDSSDITLFVPTLKCNITYSLKGGKIQTLMTRSHLFVNYETSSTTLASNEIINNDNSSTADCSLQICAGDEESKMIYIWEASTGDMKHRLRTLSSPILDICSMVKRGSRHKLLALSATQLHVYRWKK